MFVRCGTPGFVAPEVININNKYYIAEVSKIEDEARTFDDPDVQKALNAQLNFKMDANQGKQRDALRQRAKVITKKKVEVEIK